MRFTFSYLGGVRFFIILGLSVSISTYKLSYTAQTVEYLAPQSLINTGSLQDNLVLRLMEMTDDKELLQLDFMKPILQDMFQTVPLFQLNKNHIEEAIELSQAIKTKIHMEWIIDLVEKFLPNKLINFINENPENFNRFSKNTNIVFGLLAFSLMNSIYFLPEIALGLSIGILAIFYFTLGLYVAIKTASYSEGITTKVEIRVHLSKYSNKPFTLERRFQNLHTIIHEILHVTQNHKEFYFQDLVSNYYLIKLLKKTEQLFEEKPHFDEEIKRIKEHPLGVNGFFLTPFKTLKFPPIRNWIKNAEEYSSIHSKKIAYFESVLDSYYLKQSSKYFFLSKNLIPVTEPYDFNSSLAYALHMEFEWLTSMEFDSEEANKKVIKHMKRLTRMILDKHQISYKDNIFSAPSFLESNKLIEHSL